MTDIDTKLTVATAEIRTVEVGIGAKGVSIEQMPLGLFRQLYEEPLIADDGRLNGTPWCAANYDKEGEADGRVYVIWQRGSELRRDRLARDPYLKVFCNLRLADPVGLAMVEEKKGYGTPLSSYDRERVILDYSYRARDRTLWIYVKRYGQGQAIAWAHDVPLLEFAERTGAFLEGPDLEAAAATEATRELSRELKRINQWKISTEAIGRLPQLFIV